MGDNKEFTVGVKVQLEGIEALERKIRELNSNQKIVEQASKSVGKLEGVGLAGISPQIKDSLEKAGKEYQKALGGLMGNYLKEVNAIKQAMEDQVKKAKELTAERDKQIKGSQEYLRLQKEIESTDANARTEGQRYNSALEKGSTIFNNSGKGPAQQQTVGQQITNEFGGAKAMGFAAAAAFVTALPTFLRQEGIRDIVTQEATGSAIAGTTGREMNSMLSGNGIREMAWMPEKAKAVRDAARAQKFRTAADTLSPLSTIAGAGLAGAGIGAAAGAWGGPLAGATALGGGAAGLVAGVGKVGYDMMTDPMYRARQMSYLPGSIGRSYGETYKGYQAQQFSENFTKSLSAQQDLNPAKSVALDYMSKNGARDLGSQRQLGLSDQDMYGAGGYYKRMTGAGFTPESGNQMSSSILAAGGSTRAARESVMGLYAQRNMDMTNAGSVMGKISGSAGNTGASEQIFKKLLEASVKAGLDNSEFREEQRKFAETTAGILSAAGVGNADDAAKVLAGFGRFMGDDKSMRGMEGAKNAYQEYQSGTSETGGRGGAIQFAEMMKDKSFAKLQPGQVGGLMEIPDNQLSADHPRIIAAAHQMGLEPEALVGKLKQSKFNKSMVEVGIDPEKSQALGKWMTDFGMDTGGKLQKTELDYMQQANPEGYKLYQKIVGQGSMKSQYQDKFKSSAWQRGVLGGPEGFDFSTGAGDQVNNELGQGPGRTQDKAEQAQATIADALISNFSSFKDSIVPATQAVDDFTRALIVMSSALANAPEADKAKMAQRIFEDTKLLYKKEATKNQPQGGKPPPGK